MKVEIRIPGTLYEEMFADLLRPHPHAFERVGFLSSSIKKLSPTHHLVILGRYHSVPDDDYLEDPTVGASIGSRAITAAMQRSLSESSGQFHVHIHQHEGEPYPSNDDKAGLPPIVSSLSATSPAQASGYLIFSADSAWSELILPTSGAPCLATKISVVGFPIRFLK